MNGGSATNRSLIVLPPFDFILCKPFNNNSFHRYRLSLRADGSFLCGGSRLRPGYFVPVDAGELVPGLLARITAVPATSAAKSSGWAPQPLHQHQPAFRPPPTLRNLPLNFCSSFFMVYPLLICTPLRGRSPPAAFPVSDSFEYLSLTFLKALVLRRFYCFVRSAAPAFQPRYLLLEGILSISRSRNLVTLYPVSAE